MEEREKGRVFCVKGTSYQSGHRIPGGVCRASTPPHFHAAISWLQIPWCPQRSTLFGGGPGSLEMSWTVIYWGCWWEKEWEKHGWTLFLRRERCSKGCHGMMGAQCLLLRKRKNSFSVSWGEIAKTLFYDGIGGSLFWCWWRRLLSHGMCKGFAGAPQDRRRKRLWRWWEVFNNRWCKPPVCGFSLPHEIVVYYIKRLSMKNYGRSPEWAGVSGLGALLGPDWGITAGNNPYNVAWT